MGEVEDVVTTVAEEEVTILTTITMVIPCTVGVRWMGTIMGTTCTVVVTVVVVTMTTIAGEGTFFICSITLAPNRFPDFDLFLILSVFNTNNFIS